MDKNTIIGFILIAVIVIGFSWLNKPTEQQKEQKQEQIDSLHQEREKVALEQTRIEDSIAKTNKQEVKVNDFFHPLTQNNDTLQNDTLAPVPQEVKEQIVSLENEVIKIDVSTKGAQMVKAHLKGYKTYEEKPLYLFDNDSFFSLELENKSSVKLNTINANFIPVQTKDSSVLTMRLNYTDTQYVDFIYSVFPNSYMVKFDVVAVGMDDILSRDNKDQFVFTWGQNLRRQEKSVNNEQRYSRIHYKNVGLDVEELSESKSDKREVSEKTKWVAFKDQYFATTLIADETFDIAILNSDKFEDAEATGYLKRYQATLFTKPEVSDKGALHTGFRYFMGPLNYSMLKDYDAGIDNKAEQLDLDKLVPLGWTLFRWVNQYFVIPLFNLLNKTGLSMGIIILLLTVIVKLIISPLTFKSFMSSAKMRVLRPQVEEVNAKYPKQEQAMERQRATMDLYSKAGVNPMSGCIPMLLQMPILIALFAFFPSAIELRQESFLWATDLSTYDAIFEWKANIPLISWALGNHISLFCVLMTATNIIYTKFNMDATNTGQQQMPGMKLMMYFMPLIFLFVLNSYPSGLTYYYFLSTLITILLTISFRFLVNEEALLAKLEANKKKPKKKSGFMARLEEAQKMQQQQAKANAKKRK
ncbi:MAG: membrane protein insertase YidC [Dysgonomonas sp.]